MDLISQINETTNQHEAEDAVFESNCIAAAATAEIELEELTESVIEWLAGIADQIQNGSLMNPAADNTAAMSDHADKMKGNAEIMGAITALTDPDMADAMNVKNPKALLKVASSGHPQSDKALEYLKGLGRSEAAGYTKRVAQVFQSGDAAAITSVVKGLQNKAKKLLLLNAQPQQSATGELGESMPGLLGLTAEMKKPQKI